MLKNPFSQPAAFSPQTSSSYFRQFMTNPRATGSVVPSSAALCNTMLSQVDWASSLSIAELGAARGVLTQGILSRMRADAQLDAYEINPDFFHPLRAIDDRRFNLVAESAEKLRKPYDAVFSCLPLLSLPLRTSVRILHQIRQHMTPQGIFIQFQYSPLSERLLSHYFRWQRVVVMRNMPPALVYVCTPRHN